MKEYICPQCNKEVLLQTSEIRTAHVKGTTIRVAILVEFSMCDACGIEVITPEQDRRNEKRIQDRLNEL